MVIPAAGGRRRAPAGQRGGDRADVERGPPDRVEHRGAQAVGQPQVVPLGVLVDDREAQVDAGSDVTRGRADAHAGQVTSTSCTPPPPTATAAGSAAPVTAVGHRPPPREHNARGDASDHGGDRPGRGPRATMMPGAADEASATGRRDQHPAERARSGRQHGRIASRTARFSAIEPGRPAALHRPRPPPRTAAARPRAPPGADAAGAHEDLADHPDQQHRAMARSRSGTSRAAARPRRVPPTAPASHTRRRRPASPRPTGDASPATAATGAAAATRRRPRTRPDRRRRPDAAGQQPDRAAASPPPVSGRHTAGAQRVLARSACAAAPARA